MKLDVMTIENFLDEENITDGEYRNDFIRYAAAQSGESVEDVLITEYTRDELEALKDSFLD